MSANTTKVCDLHRREPPPREIEARLSPRISLLRRRALAFADDVDPCERGRAVMESYARTEGQPPIIRRAQAVARVLETQALLLDPGDLLCGRVRRGIPGHTGIHEGYQWVRAAMYPEYTGPGALPDDAPVSAEFRQSLEKFHEHYTSPWRKLDAAVPGEERIAMEAGVYNASGLDLVHRISRFEMLLDMGVEGLRRIAEEKLRSLPPTSAKASRQRDFYRAMMIVYDGLTAYARRWSERLTDLARSEGDQARRKELQEMARICARVPARPPNTFHEALQAVWFLQMANLAEVPGSAGSFGRFDQYMYPFFAADLQAGRLDRERALELLECLWLKCYRTFDFHYLTVGGVTPNGDDGTNDLSYLCLEATERLRLPRDIGVRIHPGTPPDFLRKAAAVAKLGLGRPDFWNDEVTIRALTEAGIPLEDARDYAVIGCVELTIPGKCNSRTMGHAMNLAKCLELALNNGECQLTGRRVGPPTGETFASYEELHAAYREHARRFIRLAITQDMRAYSFQAREVPMPVLSAFTEGCLETGRGVMDGGAVYNPSGVNLFGISEIANSLAAIKKFVFDEKAITLDRLREALRRDFEGDEALRQMLLNRAPKFGNGDEDVDRIAAEEMAFYCDEVARYPTPEGGRHHALVFGTSPPAIHFFGKRLGASADGRRAGAPVSTSLNPAHGTERSGATAEIKSVANMPHHKAPGGVSFILDLHPTAVEGEAGLDKLVSLLRTYMDCGGMEIGLNILNEQTLREAQSDPENYGHVMVRVFGFSTQFISLDRATQEYVIEKTKHAN